MEIFFTLPFRSYYLAMCWDILSYRGYIVVYAKDADKLKSKNA